MAGSSNPLRNQLTALGILHESGEFRDWRPLVGPISVIYLAGGAYALHRNSLTPGALGAATASIIILASSYVAMLRSSCADVPNRTAKLRPCYKCDPPRAVTDDPRTHHCWECGGCMAGFDHHCAFLHMCVGASNYGRFLMLICAYALIDVALIAWLALHAMPAAAGWPLWRLVAAWVHGLFAALMACLILTLVGLHVYLMRTRQTTYEFILSWRRPIAARAEQDEEPASPARPPSISTARNTSASEMRSVSSETEEDVSAETTTTSALDGAVDLGSPSRNSGESSMASPPLRPALKRGSSSLSARSFSSLAGAIVLPDDLMEAATCRGCKLSADRWNMM